MKVTILQENLSKFLNQTLKAVSNKPNIAILANILIKAEKGKIRLSTTNLEIGVNAWIGGDIEEEGAVTVSARLLTEFVNSLTPGKLQLSQIDNIFVVKSVDNRAEFNIIPASDFPKVPEASGKSVISLNALDFASAIRKVAFAAAVDDSRPVLTGILFEVTSRSLALIGVDGFRLSKKVLELKNGPEEDFKEIVPAKSLSDLAGIIRDVAGEDDEVEIFLSKNKNQMLFKVANITFSTRLVEGDFPDYEEILPKEKVTNFYILKSEFENGVKIASIFARNVIGNKVVFKLKPEEKRLQLSAGVVDIGSNQSDIKVTKVEGEEVETAFNIKFLQDMLNSITGDEILFESNGTASPGVFKDKDDENFLHIIMPMKLD